MTRLRDLPALLTIAALAGCSAGSIGSAPPAASASNERAPAAAATYQFNDLGAGPNGGVAEALGANSTRQGGDYVYTRDSCGKVCSFNVYHALAWSGAGSKPVDITPPLINFAEAWVYGGNGANLVGYGVTDQGGYFGVPHALLWRGTALTWKDINPAGDAASYAYATGGSSIVGSGESAGAIHALLWTISNLSAPVDLHPGTAYSGSEALGVYQTKQVGYATFVSATPTQHAMLWSGSAASAVDLTPSNVTSAYAYAVSATLEAGCGVVAPATTSHALLWNGTAAGMKDVNPTGFTDSCARAVRGSAVAGYGHVSGLLHAVLWTGGGKSAVDLQASMPAGYTQSQAFAFDSLGNVVGKAYIGGAWHGAIWLRQ